MKTMQISALAALMTGAAVVLAAPASAELTDGTYTLVGNPSNGEGEFTFTVTVASCGTGCKKLTSETGAVAEYHLDGNTWRYTTPGTGSVFTINNDSLAGSMVPDPTSNVSVPIHLVKTG